MAVEQIAYLLEWLSAFRLASSGTSRSIILVLGLLAGLCASTITRLSSLVWLCLCGIKRKVEGSGEVEVGLIEGAIRLLLSEAHLHHLHELALLALG